MHPDGSRSGVRRDVAVYYGVAIGTAVLVALTARDPAGGGLLGLYMLTPLLGLLAMQALTRSGRGWRETVAGLGLGRAGFAGWPFALLVPPVLIGAVTLAASATGAVHLVEPPDHPPLALWLAQVPVMLAIGCVFAFGEEVGWRGWLLCRLLPLGVWPAMLVTGALHAAWHLPAILITPHYHADGAPWIVVPGFLAVLTLAGIAYGYLRLSTGSLWPAVLLHAAFNLSLGTAESFVAPADAAMADYLAGESGLFSILALCLLALGIARYWPAGRLHAA